jgi:hypothetical protein
MPDHTRLQVGDWIRLLRVPECDLAQRERELVAGLEDAGWTADTIERILAQQPVVTISWLDEYGHPWFEVELRDQAGEVEYHSLNVTDDESWEQV